MYFVPRAFQLDSRSTSSKPLVNPIFFMDVKAGLEAQELRHQLLQNHARYQADQQSKQQKRLQNSWPRQAQTASWASTTTLRRPLSQTKRERSHLQVRSQGTRRAAWQEKRGQTAYALSPVHRQVNKQRHAAHCERDAVCSEVRHTRPRAQRMEEIRDRPHASPVWCWLMMMMIFLVYDIIKILFYHYDTVVLKFISDKKGGSVDLIELLTINVLHWNMTIIVEEHLRISEQVMLLSIILINQ